MFDLTKTYIGGQLLPLNEEQLQQVESQLDLQYHNNIYRNAVNGSDFKNLHSPNDLSAWRGVYIDSDLYKVNINITNKEWNIKYNNDKIILSGTINSDYTQLIGAPTADGAMIEFPVNQQDPNPTGVRCK